MALPITTIKFIIIFADLNTDLFTLDNLPVGSPISKVEDGCHLA